jgi:transposase-like protein
MVGEVQESYKSQWAAIEAVAAKLGIGCAETLRVWVRQAEVDTGQRVGVSSEEQAEIKVSSVRSRSCGGPTRSLRRPRFWPPRRS